MSEKRHRTDHPLAYTRARALVDYGWEVENEIVNLQSAIEQQHPQLMQRYNARWLAIKLLEEDSDIIAKIKREAHGEALLELAEQSVAHLREVYGDDADTIIADRRYGWIHGLVKEVVHYTRPDRITRSDKIDKFVTHPLLGVPIFLVVMWVLFKITTDVTAPYMDWIGAVIEGPITRWTVSLVHLAGLGNTWVEHLFVEGIIAGVGGILVFVPVLTALYAVLAVLEDSGYMARAAFVMDGLMHVLGLHGKSFIPMILGFGCSVPALFATRTLDNEQDRVLTGLLVPFMSCSARLPVYVLFASIFFPQNSGIVVFWMYVVGVLVALLLGLLLKNSLFKEKEESPFVMELPPYRMPTFKAVWFHTREHTGSFIRKAGTLILAASMFFWLLQAIPVRGDGSFAQTDIADSAFAAIAQDIAPLLKPAGFGTWEASSALVAGFLAKEVVVSSLAQAYAPHQPETMHVEQSSFFKDLGFILSSFIQATWDTIKAIPAIVGRPPAPADQDTPTGRLSLALHRSFDQSSNGHGPLAAISFMLFVLLYTPCMAAVAAEKQELGVKWMWVSIAGQTTLAWLMAVLVFQVGVLLGLG